MTTQHIVIVNTGCANISSVRFALERLGVAVTISEDASTITSADKVLLPGVGSASAAMKSIRAKRLEETLQRLTQPVLGICLGMQLMVQSSAENQDGNINCLNLMPGKVERMQVGDLRLPHMGWNTVAPVGDNPLFAGIPKHSYFYFVHSFCVATGKQTLASCEYGAPFSAALKYNNFYGVQFHPERSGDAGAQLIKNFVEHV